MTQKKVMLFYADWCGHCTKFKPVWEQLKSGFDQRGIAHEEHESAEKEIMDVFDIQGYPTIKIEQSGIVSDYPGSRDRDSILSYVSEQSGGGRNFYEKYIDIKNQYTCLRKQVMTGGAQGQEGIQGPAGPVGPVGPAGPAGPAGRGISHIESVTQNGNITLKINYDDGSDQDVAIHPPQ